MLSPNETVHRGLDYPLIDQRPKSQMMKSMTLQEDCPEIDNKEETNRILRFMQRSAPRAQRMSEVSTQEQYVPTDPHNEHPKADFSKLKI